MMKKTKNKRNILRCDKCGFSILTDAGERNCARCDNKMKFIGKEQ